MVNVLILLKSDLIDKDVQLLKIADIFSQKE